MPTIERIRSRAASNMNGSITPTEAFTAPPTTTAAVPSPSRARSVSATPATPRNSMMMSL